MLPFILEAEANIFQAISRVLFNFYTKGPIFSSFENMLSYLDVETITKIVNKEILCDEQIEALRLMATLPIVPLSGLAGTGKTEVLRIFYECLVKKFQSDEEIDSCCFTGMASDNLSKRIGKGKTLHKVILSNRFIKEKKKKRGRRRRDDEEDENDEDDSLENDDNHNEMLGEEGRPAGYYSLQKKQVAIFDESSNLTIILLAQYLKLTKDLRCIIFSGDPNQIPNIGIGDPFRAFIHIFGPDTSLKINHRTNPSSSCLYYNGLRYLANRPTSEFDLSKDLENNHPFTVLNRSKSMEEDIIKILNFYEKKTKEYNGHLGHYLFPDRINLNETINQIRANSIIDLLNGEILDEEEEEMNHENRNIINTTIEKQTDNLYDKILNMINGESEEENDVQEITVSNNQPVNNENNDNNPNNSNPNERIQKDSEKLFEKAKVFPAKYMRFIAMDNDTVYKINSIVEKEFRNKIEIKTSNENKSYVIGSLICTLKNMKAKKINLTEEEKIVENADIREKENEENIRALNEINNSEPVVNNNEKNIEIEDEEEGEEDNEEEREGEENNENRNSGLIIETSSFSNGEVNQIKSIFYYSKMGIKNGIGLKIYLIETPNDFFLKKNEVFIEMENGKILSFNRINPKDLERGWSSTSNKVQGLEFPISIIYLKEKSAPIFVKNHLFSAITRGISKVILICNQNLKEIEDFRSRTEINKRSLLSYYIARSHKEFLKRYYPESICTKEYINKL
jgi:hypothetical protein